MVELLMKANRKIALILVSQVVLVFGVAQLSVFIGSSPNDTSLIENKDIIQQGRETPSTSQQTQNEIFSDLNPIKQSKNVSADFVLFIVSLSLAANTILVLVIIKILKKEHSRVVRYEKFAALGELAARITHDLRNPLFVMQTAIKTLFTKHSIVAESAEMLSISKSIFKMDHLMNDVLNFLRSQKIEMKLTSFNQIILDALDGLPVPSNITIVLSDTDKIIYCDPQQLRRVIVNLVDNAVAAIGEASGRIQIKFSEIAEFVVCQIIDSGPGIPKEYIKKVFEPLFTTKNGGTGLGLYSSKMLIEQQGGRLFFHNNPTTFEIFVKQKSKYSSMKNEAVES